MAGNTNLKCFILGFHFWISTTTTQAKTENNHNTDKIKQYTNLELWLIKEETGVMMKGKKETVRWFGQTSVGVIAYLASVGFFRSDTFETNLP